MDGGIVPKYTKYKIPLYVDDSSIIRSSINRDYIYINVELSSISRATYANTPPSRQQRYRMDTGVVTIMSCSTHPARVGRSAYDTLQ